MREAIGGTWLFQIVIFFILLFTGYMCLSINHSKAFNVKDRMLEAIEQNNGIDLNSDINENNKAMEDITKYLKENSYRTSGKCPSDLKDADSQIIAHYIGFNRDGKLDSNNPAFCIAEVNTASGIGVSGELPKMTYYKVVVFYQLDLPIFRNLFMFTLKGDTKVLSVSR